MSASSAAPVPPSSNSPSTCAAPSGGQPGPAYDLMVELADVLQARYRAHPHRAVLRFGQWVMNECHPLEVNPTLFYCEDESKARALLITHWATGRLDLASAQRFASGALA